jgi:uncharacterized protein
MTTYPFRSALVTGASAGIGEAMVRRLAADGVAVTMVARRGDRLDALAAELAGCTPLVADLSTDDGIAAAARALVDEPVDVLVNNAGFGTGTSFARSDPQRLDDEIRVNVLAVMALSRAAAGTMVPLNRGWILNVSSVAGFQPMSHEPVYAATKAFVTNFSIGLALQLRGTGVKVTALCPGYTRTEFHEVSTPGEDPGVPDALWMTADEVAAAGLDAMARGEMVEIPGKRYRAAAKLGAVVSPKVVHVVTERVTQRAERRRLKSAGG